MDQAALLKLRTGREPEAIARTLAMMAYNPAIGRVLEEGGVGHFEDLMADTVQRFYGEVSRERFDALHAETCGRIIASFKTAKKRETVSYGQAQKPLNVFLKVYVDWAKQPCRELAEKLAPFLHVPLDSLLMKFIKREFPEEYGNRIGRLRSQKRDQLAERIARHLNVTSGVRGVARQLQGNEFSLTSIDKEQYLAWQQLLRSLYPAKPVLLDIIWVHERSRIRETPSAEGE
jgi:hypothetical protein